MGDVNSIGDATGVKTQNEEWFATDLVPTKNSKFRTTISLNVSVKIQVTLDSGTTWVTLNSDVALTANSLYVFDVAVRVKDNFNMRIPTAGGATVELCRIDEISGEG